VATFSYTPWLGGPIAGPSIQCDERLSGAAPICPPTGRPPVHWHALSCRLDLSERAACPEAAGGEDLAAAPYY
jgi:hypothetical protein